MPKISKQQAKQMLNEAGLRDRLPKPGYMIYIIGGPGQGDETEWIANRGGKFYHEGPGTGEHLSAPWLGPPRRNADDATKKSRKASRRTATASRGCRAFPLYRTHDAARCFNCGEPLDEIPVSTGYPSGRFKQRCTSCGLKTHYDVHENPALFIDDFTEAYLECALWASVDDRSGDPLDENWSPEDIAPETLDEMIDDCRTFQNDNADDLDHFGSDAYAGHDFWLTRNGHGTGFWDRGIGTLGKRLTKAAKAYGPYALYVDDGVIRGYGG